MIPEELVNEIRQRADIVEVIGEFVKLEKAGQNYKGLCPFHKEKTPSFTVNPTKQIFHCYGCGVGGNVFTFLMKHEQYSFPETLHILARRFGVRLPEKSDDVSTQQLQQTERLYQLHLEVCAFFAEQLRSRPEAKIAREYLCKRGIDEEAQQRFGFGYALPAWDALRRKFIQKYGEDLLLESGLVVKRKSEDGEEARQMAVGSYDRFRDRLMIPIHDERGRIIAFGGRILGDGQPKYMNSPENPIFHKGKTLFGFHHVKDAVRRLGTIVLVEGYFDMIVPFAHGVPNIAATMGTALTDQHLRALQRYAQKVTLIFDPDPAGVNAMMKALDLFLTYGFEVRAGILPTGDDPDTFVRKAGVAEFQRIVEHAPLLLDFIRDRIIERYDTSRLDQQIACANQLLPTILKIQNIIERTAQITKTSDLLHITDDSLLQQFRKVAHTGIVDLRKTEEVKTATTIPIIEQYVVTALLKDKRLISKAQAHIQPDELSHPLTRRVLKALFVYGDKSDFEAKMLDMFQGSEFQGELSRLFMRSEEVVDPAVTLQDCIVKFRQQRFEQATLDVTRKTQDAQERKDRSDLDILLEQKNQDLLRKKQQLMSKPT